MYSFLGKNHYERLGVKREATFQEIKSAYRQLARIHHPDVSDQKFQANEIFFLISEAHQTLFNPEKRRAYDVSLSRKNRFPSFERKPRARTNSFFVKKPSFKTKQAGDNKPVPEKEINLDAQATIKVSLEDVMSGSTHAITVDFNGGERFKRSKGTYRVKIPKGLWQGQQLRLKGCGFEDVVSRRKGDLFLTIERKKHNKFQLIDDNLLAEVEVEQWTTVAGADFTVLSFDGETDFKIPAGAKSGQRIWIKGKGMPKRNGERGDLIVVLKVLPQENFSECQDDFWVKVAV